MGGWSDQTEIWAAFYDNKDLKSIASFIFHMRGDQAKYDLDQAKIFLCVRRGLRHKIVITKQFDWTASTALLCLNWLVKVLLKRATPIFKCLKNIRFRLECLKNTLRMFKNYSIPRICSSQRGVDSEQKRRRGSGVVLDLCKGCIARVIGIKRVIS